MTDREFMVAIYQALEKVYLELTGKPLSVTVPCGNGALTIFDHAGARLLNETRQVSVQTPPASF